MMRKIADIPVEKINPSIEKVLKGQGIPDQVKANKRTIDLARKALSSFMVLARPSAVTMEITGDQFKPIYAGEGLNADDTPLDDIIERADSFALFAVTIGETICAEIGRLFESGDYAQGAMLDSTASEGTELLANQVEQSHREYLLKKNRLASSHSTCQFSPGYCGWHVSAQKKLFQTLRPEEIGISLNDSFLMEPLKSISGAIIVGEREIFVFEDDFEFCVECRTRSCRDRIRAVKEK
ncbi:MAG: hypothetical protein JSU74_11585 [Candidatus Zixiibacteriota bacterium]|nr:MAG: hypothetical protein JSU74_11585 [candidate division Zixibacteria bacterium]